MFNVVNHLVNIMCVDGGEGEGEGGTHLFPSRSIFLSPYNSMYSSFSPAYTCYFNNSPPFLSLSLSLPLSPPS